jgi:hypothetical protein
MAKWRPLRKEVEGAKFADVLKSQELFAANEYQRRQPVDT